PGSTHPRSRLWQEPRRLGALPAEPGREQADRRSAKSRIRLGSVQVPPWGNDEVLAWLEEEERSNTWSALEKAALGLVKGLKRAGAGAHKDALGSLLPALDVFGDRNLHLAVTNSANLFSISVTH